MAVAGVRAGVIQDTRRRVERRLRRAGLDVAAGHIDQFVDYLLLLDTWNRRMNLTARDDNDPDRDVDRLIVEPALAAAVIDVDADSLIDIGSGGGSPAIPLKIVRSSLALTMVEAKTRKSVFLREVVRHLGLTHATVETVRFEQLLSRPAMLEAVDVVSIRAVRAEQPQLRLFQAVLRPQGQQLWFLSRAQPTQPIPPPLVFEQDLPLVESLRSRLLVLRKA